LALPLTATANALTFTLGDYYTSNGSVINQFAPDGSIKGSVRPNGPTSIGTETRGIAFGPDGLLYVVRNNAFGYSGSGSAGVDVMDQTGHVIRSYRFPGWIGGLISAGDIAFAKDGQSFYVGASDGIYKFNPQGTTGTRITSGAANDLAVMPNGDIVAVSDYSLTRYTSTGALISSVGEFLNDPLGLTAGRNILSPTILLVDGRGIAYDPTTDTTYVSMLGYTGMFYEVLALDGFSSNVKGIVSYSWPADLFVGGDDNLLVGSWTQSPAIFDAELNRLVKTMGGPAIFVTAMTTTIPEPDTALLTIIGLVALRSIRKSNAKSQGSTVKIENLFKVRFFPYCSASAIAS
jgi:hypothetical protein